MSLHLIRDLESLQRDILTMCGMTEDLVGGAVEELGRPTDDGAGRLKAEDLKIDWYDVQIEEKCLGILAAHQPVATELRRTIAALRISKELERCGDIAVNIAERVGGPARPAPEIEVPKRLTQMAGVTLDMLRRSIDAYVELDAERAQSVCGDDDVVDELNRRVIGELTEQMRSSPDRIEPSLSLFSASRHLERIADHATNIAKETIYMVEGTIVRHRKRFPDRVPGEAAEARFGFISSGRVETLLRRALETPASADRVSLHGIDIDRLRHVCRSDGRELSLTLTEFRLLWTLIRQPGRPFSRNELMDTARGEDANALERTIDVHVRSLRQKLGDKSDYVETVRGVGYRFKSDTE